jgi:hypothetical protein
MPTSPGSSVESNINASSFSNSISLTSHSNNLAAKVHNVLIEQVSVKNQHTSVETVIIQESQSNASQRNHSVRRTSSTYISPKKLDMNNIHYSNFVNHDRRRSLNLNVNPEHTLNSTHSDYSAVANHDHRRTYSEFPLKNINLVAVRNFLHPAHENQTNQNKHHSHNHNLNNHSHADNPPIDCSSSSSSSSKDSVDVDMEAKYVEHYLDSAAIETFNYQQSESSSTVAELSDTESMTSFLSSTANFKPLSHLRSLSFDGCDSSMLKYSAILNDLLTAQSESNNAQNGENDLQADSELMLAAKIGQQLLEKNNNLIEENKNIRQQLEHFHLQRYRNSNNNNNNDNDNKNLSNRNSAILNEFEEKELEDAIGLSIEEESVYDFVRRQLIHSAQKNSINTSNVAELSAVYQRFGSLGPAELLFHYKKSLFAQFQSYSRLIRSQSTLSSTNNVNSAMISELKQLRAEKREFLSRFRALEISHLADSRTKLRELRLTLARELLNKGETAKTKRRKPQTRPQTEPRTIKITISARNLPLCGNNTDNLPAFLSVALFTRSGEDQGYIFQGRTEKQSRNFAEASSNTPENDIVFSRSIILRSFITNLEGNFRFSVFSMVKTEENVQEILLGTLNIDSYALFTAFPHNSSEHPPNRHNSSVKKISQDVLKSLELQEKSDGFSVRTAELCVFNRENCIEEASRVKVSLHISPPLDWLSYPRFPGEEEELELEDIEGNDDKAAAENPSVEGGKLAPLEAKQGPNGTQIIERIVASCSVEMGVSAEGADRYDIAVQTDDVEAITMPVHAGAVVSLNNIQTQENQQAELISSLRSEIEDLKFRLLESQQKYQFLLQQYQDSQANNRQSQALNLSTMNETAPHHSFASVPFSPITPQANRISSPISPNILDHSYSSNNSSFSSFTSAVANLSIDYLSNPSVDLTSYSARYAAMYSAIKPDHNVSNAKNSTRMTLFALKLSGLLMLGNAFLLSRLLTRTQNGSFANPINSTSQTTSYARLYYS